MMKIGILLAAFFIVTSQSNGQTQNYFEGAITYKHDWKSKLPNVDDARLEKIIGTSAALFLKKATIIINMKVVFMNLICITKPLIKCILKSAIMIRCTGIIAELREIK